MRNAAQVSAVSMLIQEFDTLFASELAQAAAESGVGLSGPLTKEVLSSILIASTEEGKKIRNLPTLRQKYYPEEEPKKEEVSKKDAKKLAKDQKKFEKAKKKYDEAERKKQERQNKRKSASLGGSPFLAASAPPSTTPSSTPAAEKKKEDNLPLDLDNLAVQDEELQHFKPIQRSRGKEQSEILEEVIHERMLGLENERISSDSALREGRDGSGIRESTGSGIRESSSGTGSPVRESASEDNALKRSKTADLRREKRRSTDLNKLKETSKHSPSSSLGASSGPTSSPSSKPARHEVRT